MIDITVIIGLPGSGKTRLALSMVDLDTFMIDDLSLHPERMTLFAESPTPKLVITDPVAVAPNAIRSRLAQWLPDHAHTVTIIAFTNEPDRCFENVIRRGDSRIIELVSIQKLSMRYQPELYDKVVPVYVPQ